MKTIKGIIGVFVLLFSFTNTSGGRVLVLKKRQEKDWEKIVLKKIREKIFKENIPETKTGNYN